MKAFLAALAVCIAMPAAAQQRCWPRENVIETLVHGYGQFLQGSGLSATSQVIEIYASPRTGTFTITQSSPWGATCILVSGQDYHRSVGPPPPASTGDPL